MCGTRRLGRDWVANKIIGGKDLSRNENKSQLITMIGSLSNRNITDSCYRVVPCIQEEEEAQVDPMGDRCRSKVRPDSRDKVTTAAVVAPGMGEEEPHGKMVRPGNSKCQGVRPSSVPW